MVVAVVEVVFVVARKIGRSVLVKAAGGAGGPGVSISGRLREHWNTGLLLVTLDDQDLHGFKLIKLGARLSFFTFGRFRQKKGTIRTKPRKKTKW